MQLFIIAIGVSMVIVCIELLLWRLFRTRIEGLILPRSADSSALQFFTMGRARLCALLHTIGLLVLCNGALFLFW